MLKIKTGYFAKAALYERSGYAVVSISRWSPKWLECLECKELAPSTDLLNRYKNGQASAEDYTVEFEEYLEGVDLKAIADLFSEKAKSAGKVGIVFCCYEKPRDFCHRHIVAAKYKEKLGIDVEEFPV